MTLKVNAFQELAGLVLLVGKYMHMCMCVCVHRGEYSNIYAVSY